MSGCIKSRHSALTAALIVLWCIGGWMSRCRRTRTSQPGRLQQSKKFWTIHVIIIESLGINDCLLAAFTLAKRKEGLSSHESFLFYTIFSWQVSSSSLNKGQECPPPGWLLLDGCVWTSNNHTCSLDVGLLHISSLLQTRRDAFGEIDLAACKQNRGGSQQVSHSHNAYNGACSLTAELWFSWCFSPLWQWHCRKIYCKK